MNHVSDTDSPATADFDFMFLQLCCRLDNCRMYAQEIGCVECCLSIEQQHMWPTFPQDALFFLNAR